MRPAVRTQGGNTDLELWKEKVGKKTGEPFTFRQQLTSGGSAQRGSIHEN